jgi:hypothetical protein
VTKFHIHTKLQAKLQYFNFYIFGQHIRKQKVLNWMVASITWV